MFPFGWFLLGSVYITFIQDTINKHIMSFILGFIMQSVITLITINYNYKITVITIVMR